MTFSFAKRVTQVKPSATFAINAKANALKAEGHDIINLSVGEPDFDTPDYVKTAAIEAIRSGFTRYTAADGIPELKAAIIKKMQHDNGLTYSPKEVIVSCGVKQSLYNLCQVLLDQDDEALIPAPYWVSYPAMVLLAEGTPVTLPTTLEQRFKITPEQLEAAITDKTRLLFLNSPSNPSGMVYSKDELAALGEVLLKHPKVIIASDDIYEYIVWPGINFSNIVNACPALRDRVVVFNGVSKSHAMTGWRIGYAAGNEAIIAAMKKIQSQSTSSPNSVAQKASVAALKEDRETLKHMIEEYKTRHDMMFETLSSYRHVKLAPSDGTFYLFLDITSALKKYGMKDDISLADYLLDEARIACVPGTAFGSPGYIRFSCATSVVNLKTALKRLEPILNGGD